MSTPVHFVECLKSHPDDISNVLINESKREMRFKVRKHPKKVRRRHSWDPGNGTHQGLLIAFIRWLLLLFISLMKTINNKKKKHKYKKYYRFEVPRGEIIGRGIMFSGNHLIWLLTLTQWTAVIWIKAIFPLGKTCCSFVVQQRNRFIAEGTTIIFESFSNVRL